MSSLFNRASAMIALIVVAGLFSACVTTTGSFSSSEALVLIDGTEIPCEIFEFDSEYVYFEPALAKDRYTYGEYIALGQVRFIKVFRNNEVVVYNVNDYIDQNTVIVEEGEVAADSGRQAEQEMPTSLLEQEFGRFEKPESNASREATPTPDKTEGPGLRLARVTGDSLQQKAPTGGIGLRLPSDLAKTSTTKIAEADYNAIADMIVASGAAGLIFYRSEQLKSRGIDIADAPQTLIDYLKASEQWQKRVQGMSAANRLAREDFTKKYDEVRESVAEKFGFRPQAGQDDYLSFVLHLHTNGGLLSPRRKQQFEELFGGLAERAFSDILANFDDWYYLFVIQGRS